MYVVRVDGPPDAAGRVADRLVERLGRHGRVATVRETEVLDDASLVAAESYAVGTDGSWTARGRDRALGSLLDNLATRHEYAVLVGFPGARVPVLAVGDADVEDPIARVDPDGALDDVIDAIATTDPYESLESLVAAVKASPDAELSGAIATFTGRVRALESPDDTETKYLEFEKYAGVADDALAQLCGELESRDGVIEVAMHHRTGVIEYGEDIVFIVVLAAHREEAFRAVEDGINRLKDEVPIFKKEVTVDEEFWVHDRP